MGLVISVSLCYRDGRLEPGYSCDWEEAWSLGQHRERSGPRWGAPGCLDGLCWYRMPSCSCFVSLCHALRCPCLMLIFCEMTYVQQENNTDTWWAPAQLGTRMHILVYELRVICQLFTNVRDFHVIFKSIIYQHTRELKRYSSVYKNKEFMFFISFPIHSSALLRNKCR